MYDVNDVVNALLTIPPEEVAGTLVERAPLIASILAFAINSEFIDLDTRATA